MEHFDIIMETIERCLTVSKVLLTIGLIVPLESLRLSCFLFLNQSLGGKGNGIYFQTRVRTNFYLRTKFQFELRYQQDFAVFFN